MCVLEAIAVRDTMLPSRARLIRPALTAVAVSKSARGAHVVRLLLKASSRRSGRI